MQAEARLKRDIFRCMQDTDNCALEIEYDTDRGLERRKVSPIRMLDDGLMQCLCLNSGKAKNFDIWKIHRWRIIDAGDVMIPEPVERLWLPEGHARRFHVQQD